MLRIFFLFLAKSFRTKSKELDQAWVFGLVCVELGLLLGSCRSYIKPDNDLWALLEPSSKMTVVELCWARQKAYGSFKDECSLVLDTVLMHRKLFQARAFKFEPKPVRALNRGKKNENLYWMQVALQKHHFRNQKWTELGRTLPWKDRREKLFDQRMKEQFDARSFYGKLVLEDNCEKHNGE